MATTTNSETEKLFFVNVFPENDFDKREWQKNVKSKKFVFEVGMVEFCLVLV